MNLGLGSSASLFEWTIIFNSAIIGEGNGWTISHNGTLTVSGAAGNVSVILFDFGDVTPSSNLPFYEQHSVAIAVVAGLAVVVVIAVVVKIKSGKQLKLKAN